MTRLLAIISLALLLLGCRAPTPSMNVFAPYGSATVPPPPTGAIGTPGAVLCATANSSHHGSWLHRRTSWNAGGRRACLG